MIPSRPLRVLLVTAAVGWIWTMAGVTPANPSNVSILPWMIGALGGFVLSVVIGIPMALLIAYSKTIENYLYPLLVFSAYQFAPD